MAVEVERLFLEAQVRRKRIFVMVGHEDGVVSFGRTLEKASAALLSALAQAYER
jgi:hypothetical protein